MVFLVSILEIGSNFGDYIKTISADRNLRGRYEVTSINHEKFYLHINFRLNDL